MFPNIIMSRNTIRVFEDYDFYHKIFFFFQVRYKFYIEDKAEFDRFCYPGDPQWKYIVATIFIFTSG